MDLTLYTDATEILTEDLSPDSVYYGAESNKPFAALTLSSELDATDLGYVSTDDANNHLAASASGWVGHIIKLVTTSSSITQISVTAKGYGTGGGTSDCGWSMHIWNFTTESFSASLDSHTTTSKDTLTANITTNLSDYVDASGNIYVLLQATVGTEGAGSGSYLYYAESTISYQQDLGETELSGAALTAFWATRSDAAFPALLKYGYDVYAEIGDLTNQSKWQYIILTEGKSKTIDVPTGYQYSHTVPPRSGFSNTGNTLLQKAGSNELYEHSESYNLQWYSENSSNPTIINWNTLMDYLSGSIYEIDKTANYITRFKTDDQDVVSTPPTQIGSDWGFEDATSNGNDLLVKDVQVGYFDGIVSTVIFDDWEFTVGDEIIININLGEVDDTQYFLGRNVTGDGGGLRYNRSNILFFANVSANNGTWDYLAPNKIVELRLVRNTSTVFELFIDGSTLGVISLSDSVIYFNRISERYDGYNFKGLISSVKLGNDISYNFRTGGGTEIFDNSGNGNHGTLTGANLESFWGTKVSGIADAFIENGGKVYGETGDLTNKSKWRYVVAQDDGTYLTPTITGYEVIATIPPGVISDSGNTFDGLQVAGLETGATYADIDNVIPENVLKFDYEDNVFKSMISYKK
jgi:hypothetical protein